MVRKRKIQTIFRLVPDDMKNLQQKYFPNQPGTARKTVSLEKHQQTSLQSVFSDNYILHDGVILEVLSDSYFDTDFKDFQGSADIKSVIIAEGVTKIGMGGFAELVNLTSVVVPDTVTAIESLAFYGCVSLKNIYIPDSVSFIAKSAFNDCPYISETADISAHKSSFSETGKSAVAESENDEDDDEDDEDDDEDDDEEDDEDDDDTYYGYSKLQTAIIITLLVVLTVLMFVGTSQSKKYSFSDGTLIIYSDSYFDSDYEKFKGSEEVKKIVIEEGVTKIGASAFLNCTSLTDVTIPDSVASICSRAFYGCTSLTDITVPDSVTEIDAFAFQDCTSLAVITIPHSVIQIDIDTFYNWTSDQTIRVKGRKTAPDTWSSDWNNGCNAKIIWNP